MLDFTELFCSVDDFLKEFSKKRLKELENKQRRRNRKRSLSESEIMTILISFHASGYRNFKQYYCEKITFFHRAEFPTLVSYHRFLEYIPSVLVHLSCYLHARFEKPSEISFIDSTPLKIFHQKRISRNKVFAGIAEIGRSTMGWFFGFKLHLIVNERGGLISACLTKGNVDDRNPVPKLTKKISGKLFGDKGYISKKLFKMLFAKNLKLITGLRKNMKNKLLPLSEKLMLRKRFIIETINDQLKNISQIEHTRHRSPVNFLINVICGLIAYTFQKKKPCISGLNQKMLSVF